MSSDFYGMYDRYSYPRRYDGDKNQFLFNTTIMFHTEKPNWNPGSVDVSKLKRLEVVDKGEDVCGRLVLKEPSTADSISKILGISLNMLTISSNYSELNMFRVSLFFKLAYKSEYYANIWDPWMMDSFKTTSSVLGKRSIPADLINMIQDFTHIKDQHID